jgi:hypothetical protein
LSFSGRSSFVKSLLSVSSFTSMFFCFFFIIFYLLTILLTEHGVRPSEYQPTKSKSREYHRGTLLFSSFESVTNNPPWKGFH